MDNQETMRQQVDIWVRLTYDADATLTAQQLEAQASDDIGRLLDADSGAKIELCQFHIERIAEEAEIRDGLNDAAPDLLAACEAAAQLLLNDPNRVRDGWMTDIIRQLRKAIAKANGAAAVEQEFPSLSLDNMSRETPWENEQ